MTKYAVHIPLEARSWAVAREWQALNELCLGIWDCPHSTPDITETGPLVVRSQDIRTGVYRITDSARVSEHTYKERIARAEPRAGDILYSREGTYFAIAAEMPADQRVCLGQRMVLIRPDPRKAYSRFVWAWLNSPILGRHIHGFRDGTVAERLNMPTIRGLPVPVLSPSEQKKIGDVVGKLTDKIELNRRMNETLERMAQAIFKDWFVDFGPTRRKLAGITDPVAIMGSLTPDAARASTIAALFPDALGDDGLPVGWSKKRLSDFATITKGRSYKSEELQPSVTALVTLKSFARGGGYRPDGLKPYTGEYRADQVVGVGDIVLSQTDVTQAAEIIGRPAIVSSSGEFMTLVASLDVAIVRPKDSKATPREYLYQALADRRFVEHALAHVTGTTVLHLAKTAIPSYQMVVPGEDLPLAYDSICGAFREIILKNDYQNRTLAETRDYLLPKLMSGEVRIRDAEILAEGAPA